MLHRPDLRSLQRHHGHGFTIERDELDLECLSRFMDVHNNAYVTGGQFLFRDINGQHYALVL